MKLKIIVAGIVLIALTGFRQSECSRFRNGTFKVTDPATKKVCIITRDGNMQTERMEDTPEIYDFNITWLDDCTYTVNPTAATSARNKDVLKAGTMTVKIIKTTDTSYTQKVTVANNPKFRRIDQVFIVKKKKEAEVDKKY